MFKFLRANKSFFKAFMLTSMFLPIGIACLFLGWSNFGLALFVLLPILIGFSLGILPDKKWAFIGALIALVFFLVCLVYVGLAGFLCVIYAIPIIVPFIFLGSIVAHFIKKYKEFNSENLNILLLPIIPFLVAAPLEKYFQSNKRNVIEVKTEKIFDYTPDQVYDAIKSVDTLIAEKSFLMNFDLPVPTKCILEKEEVGGLRTCYFSGGNLSKYEYGGGTITEKITQLERGKVLKMNVINYDLVGRDWLGFKEAIYYFNKIGDNKCKLTRITTYTSVLAPRFYWQPLEIIGIEQEHDYVFNNLLRDLKK